jgi:hypothetical protein
VTTDRLTDKERALIEAAKRQAAARRAATAGQAKPNPAVSTPLDQPTVLGWDNPAASPKRSATAIDPRLLADWPTGPMASAATTPLDQPTVLGWDNPAAQQDSAAAKWERIAQLMAEERETADAERRKLKRYGLIASAVLFAAGMIVVLVLWPKPGA